VTAGALRHLVDVTTLMATNALTVTASGRVLHKALAGNNAVRWPDLEQSSPLAIVNFIYGTSGPFFKHGIWHTWFAADRPSRSRTARSTAIQPTLVHGSHSPTASFFVAALVVSAPQLVLHKSQLPTISDSSTLALVRRHTDPCQISRADSLSSRKSPSPSSQPTFSRLPNSHPQRISTATMSEPIRNKKLESMTAP
jgi:hypothetical protein